MRTLDELINTQDPCWPFVQKSIAAAKNHVEILPRPNDFERAEALRSIQVTTRSPMGALVFESGGLLIDHGWIRVLGAGHAKLPRSLPGWNSSVFADTGHERPYWLIADDALGGFFAWDTGVLGSPQMVFYHAPDTLKWENMNVDYSGFLNFCFHGDLDGYYGQLRWQNWVEEVSKLGGDQGLFVQPFLVTNGRDPLVPNEPHSRVPIGERSRKPVPIRELYELYVNELHKQFEGVEDGAVVRIVAE
jgi:hypothetical protein